LAVVTRASDTGIGHAICVGRKALRVAGGNAVDVSVAMVVVLGVTHVALTPGKPSVAVARDRVGSDPTAREQLADLLCPGR
jgi:hypothetical protein